MHTVYHCRYLTVKIANVLWEAGFREVDLLDQDDMTPLMILERHLGFVSEQSISVIIEFAFWLYQKGASFSERRVIHFLVAAFKRPDVDSGYSTMFRPYMDDLSLESRQFYHRILLSDLLDSCLCACSRHGCMPATNFLKHGNSQLHVYYSVYYSEAKKPLSTRLLRWLFENVPSKNFPVPVSREIIRLKTFEKLGLRHTCCSYESGAFYYSVSGLFKTIEPAEADEIRDEDRDGIQLLESLLPEFEEKLGDEDIKSFIDGYWTTRMEEVLDARDEEPLDWAGMEAAGVVFCDDDGSDDDGSDE